MRKFLVCTLAAALVFGAAGCGLDISKEDKDSTEFSQEDVQSWVSNLLNSMEDDQTGDLSEGLFGGMDFDELPADLQQQVKDELKEEGVDIKTNSDGSTTYVDADGSEITQNEDGTWVVTNEDGSTGQLGGDWPSNEYTKQVPKPPFGLTAASTDEYGFNVAFIGVEIDDLRDYVEKLKDLIAFSLPHYAEEGKPAVVIAIGFSTSTFLPASIAFTAYSACMALGRAMLIMSISGFVNISSKSV